MFELDIETSDRLTALLVGAAVAGAASQGVDLPAGAMEGIVAGGGLFTLLRSKRSDKPAAQLRKTRDEIVKNWTQWVETEKRVTLANRDQALGCFNRVMTDITLDKAHVIEAKANPKAIAQLVLDAATKRARTCYDPSKGNTDKVDAARALLLVIVEQAYRRILAMDAVYREIRADLWSAMLDGLQAVQENTEEILLLVRELHEVKQTTVHQDTLLALARKIRPTVANKEQALRELEAAADLAAESIKKGEQGSNTDAFVNAVLHRLVQMTEAGKIGEAARAAQDELDRAKAGISQLRDQTIRQHLLNRDATAAANLIAERIAADAPPDLFNALRVERRTWYERGRDKGLNLDLEVAIALAHHSQTHATTPDQRGAARNDLGNALKSLGEREPGTARLEQAADAYRAALVELTQDRIPLDWAATQNNLGAALQTLGEREPGTARLEQAVDAYRAALVEVTQDRVPLDWAMTQNNLGNALATLGEREPGTARLEQAIDAYRAALIEYTQDRAPLSWARTQNNLGAALQTLGARESGTARLEQAVDAYRAALVERTQDRVPLDWAMTQNNLGNALKFLGEREPGTARLEQAVDAYRAALVERTQDRVPLDWAGTRYNMSLLHTEMFWRSGDMAELDLAVSAAEEARAVFEIGAPLWVENADRLLAMLAALRNDP